MFISVIPWLLTPLWPLCCCYFRSESAEKLDVLSKKLQSVQDIDELTKMVLRVGEKTWNALTLLARPLLTDFSVKLRAASEYEERKIIRAAIRKIRDEQQQQGECSCSTAPRLSVHLTDTPFHRFDQHVTAVVCEMRHDFLPVFWHLKCRFWGGSSQRLSGHNYTVVDRNPPCFSCLGNLGQSQSLWWRILTEP